MQTAEYNHNDFQQGNGDEQLLVKFFIKAVEDKAKSAQEGRPIFKDVEYIDIRTPGQKDYVARPAREADRRRFPRHYEAFKARTEVDEKLEGTLLTEWPGVTRAQAEELAFFNVKTVEQLAGMSDQNAQQFMGINALKRKAMQYIETAKNQAASTELRNELEKRDEQLSAQSALIEEMQAQIAELSANQKKRPGRKPKAEAEQE